MERRRFLKGLAGTGMLGLLQQRVSPPPLAAQVQRDPRFPDALAESLGSRSGHLIY